MFCIEEGMVISPVGSCSTLVAQQIIAKSPCVLESNVASLLYGKIIISFYFFKTFPKLPYLFITNQQILFNFKKVFILFTIIFDIFQT